MNNRSKCYRVEKRTVSHGQVADAGALRVSGVEPAAVKVELGGDEMADGVAPAGGD